MKTLKDFMEVYEPKAPDEKKFKDKHVTIKHKDRNEVGGKENGDDVFNASNIKAVARKDNRQGYDVGEDEKVYEETDIEESLGMGYKPTSEKSKFDDGHRAKLLNPDGKLSYLSQKSYATPAHAKAAAKYYHSIGHLPSQTIDSKMRQYNKDYDTKKESVEADEINDLLGEALAILEKTLTPAELKKREEIAKAIGRENPKMPMPQKMAIATAQAKKVAEEVEEIDEISGALATRYLQKKRERDYDTSADGTYSKMKKPQSLNRIHKDIKSTVRALRTIERSNKTNEEVEAIDESAKIVAHLQKRYGDNIRKSHVMSAAKDFGVDASKLAKAVRTKLGKNMLPEEIDEGVMHNRYMRSHGKKARGTGSWAFTTKEYGPPKDHEMHFTSGQKTLSDAHKEAAEKLGTKNLYVMEEVEQVDEISADMADRYLKGKRERDYKRSDDGTYSIPRKPQSIRRKNIDAKGTSLALKTIQRPRNRLTKEDIIDRAVDKYVPEELKFTAEERLLRRLEGLSEGHIDMLMDLFESLNDTNQSMMIDSAETQEGLNQLLDFAINNRGA
jgi:hypothetical protein